MAILLSDIWPIENPQDYKVHFARWNGVSEPLEVWLSDRRRWRGWQEYRPGRRNEFNRPYIFSLMQFYHEADAWLFGGVFMVLECHPDRYRVKLDGRGKELIGRLKLRSPYRSRLARVNLENHFEDFEVQEILGEPWSGRSFPGYENIHLSFPELETLTRSDRADRKAGPGERERRLSDHRRPCGEAIRRLRLWRSGDMVPPARLRRNRAWRKRRAARMD